MDSLLQDIRYALRGFRKSPGFALTVVATVGFALGLNTTVFTVFNAYVLKTFAARDPYALYRFDWLNRKGRSLDLTWPEYQALKRSGLAFSDVAATEILFTSIDGAGFAGQLVTGNYFTVAGAGMYLGRLIGPADRGEVIVFSHTIRKDRYGADPLTIGRKVYLRCRPFDVVGVAGPPRPRAALEAALNRMGPSIADQIVFVEDMMELALHPSRVVFWLAGFLGAIALLLSTSGPVRRPVLPGRPEYGNRHPGSAGRRRLVGGGDGGEAVDAAGGGGNGRRSLPGTGDAGTNAWRHHLVPQRRLCGRHLVAPGGRPGRGLDPFPACGRHRSDEDASLRSSGRPAENI